MIGTIRWQSLIDRLGVFELRALGVGGLLVAAVVLLLLGPARVKGRGVLIALGVLGLLAVEAALFAVRTQTIPGRPPRAASRFTPKTRNAASAALVGIPLLWLGVVVALRSSAARRLRADAPLYLQEGLRHFYHNEFDEAVIAFTSAIKIEPAQADLYCKRGCAFAQMGATDLALADFDRALARNPHLLDVLVPRGAARVALGRFEEGLADIDQFLGLRPNDAHALFQRGIAFKTHGDTRRAILEFEKVLRLTNLIELAEPARIFLRELSSPGPEAGPRPAPLGIDQATGSA